MKGNSKFISILAFISLLTLVGIFVTGQLKNRQKSKENNSNNQNVLGETFESLADPNSFSGIKNSVQGSVQHTLDNTRDILSQKVVETEKVILESINKQLTTLTKSQVESVKIQICRDLGVLPTITANP